MCKVHLLPLLILKCIALHQLKVQVFSSNQGTNGASFVDPSGMISCILKNLEPKSQIICPSQTQNNDTIGIE